MRGKDDFSVNIYSDTFHETEPRSRSITGVVAKLHPTREGEGEAVKAGGEKTSHFWARTWYINKYKVQITKLYYQYQKGPRADNDNEETIKLVKSNNIATGARHIELCM